MSSYANVFPIDSRPFGLSYSDWCIKWWQWISSIPKHINPAFDWGGNKIYENQNIRVFYFYVKHTRVSIIHHFAEIKLLKAHLSSCQLSTGYRLCAMMEIQIINYWKLQVARWMLWVLLKLQ